MLLGQWGEKDLENLAPLLNKVPYVKGSYFPINTKHMLGFNEPNQPCAALRYV